MGGSGGLGAYVAGAVARGSGGIAALDGLRALAVLLVLARHIVRPFHDPQAPLFALFGWDAMTPLLNGWIGVDLFFVLSGFLIGGHLLRAQGEGRFALAPYLIQRALRILPAYVAVLAIVALGLVPYYPLAEEALGLRLAYHLLFLQDYLPADIVVAFWSLGVEEKFYLLAPLLGAAALALGDVRARLALVLAAAALGPLLRLATMLAHPGVTDYESFFPLFRSPFHVCLDPLCLGLAVALLWRERERWPWLWSGTVPHAAFWSGAMLLALLVLPAPMLDDGVTGFDQTLQPTLVALACAGLLWGALGGAGPRRWLEGGAARVLARLAYTLYLVHLPLVPLSLVLAGAAPGDGLAGLLAALPVFLALSGGAALALTLAVEHPGLILKDRLSRADRAPASSPLAAPCAAGALTKELRGG